MKRWTYDYVVEHLEEMKEAYAKENHLKTDGSCKTYNNYCAQLYQYIQENPRKVDLIQY